MPRRRERRSVWAVFNLETDPDNFEFPVSLGAAVTGSPVGETVLHFHGLTDTAIGRVFIHSEPSSSRRRGRRLIPKKLEIISHPDSDDVASECQRQLVLALRLFKSAPFWVLPWDRRADALIPLGGSPSYSLDKDGVMRFCHFSRKVADLHVWRNVYSLARVYLPILGEELSDILGLDDPQGRKLLAPRVHIVVATDFFEHAHREWGLSNELRLLLLTIAAEALFSDGDKTEVAYRLSHRLAVLNGADGAARKHLFDLGRRIYDLRSRLVHGALYRNKSGFVEVSSTDLWPFSNLVRSSLLYSLALRDLGREDLLRTLDRGVFDEAETLKLRFEANEHWGFGKSADEHLHAGSWHRMGTGRVR